MRICRWSIVIGLLFGMLGCGKRSGASDVSGSVMLDEVPLAGALVTFKPDGETPGLGGYAKTDNNGKFVLQANQGGNKIALGKYKVTISKRLNKDGSEPNPKTPPIESNAEETLLPKYSNSTMTELYAVISDSQRTTDFKLESAQK